MKVKIKQYASSFAPDLGAWIQENVLTLLTFTKVPGEGVFACGAGAGPKSHALPVLSTFSFKLAFFAVAAGLVSSQY